MLFLSTWKNTQLLLGGDKDECLGKCLGFLKSILDPKWHQQFFSVIAFCFLSRLHGAAVRYEDADLSLLKVYF